ncbi:MAG: hypothetical protein JWM46_930 [Candidatus Kaiserbacteria bacterium]|nr:hypothetical protein [Candidatus Kaiserbacteria bacterium]
MRGMRKMNDPIAIGDRVQTKRLRRYLPLIFFWQTF